jgi:beta-glucosidase
VRYPRWFGQQRLDRNDIKAAYPLGYGLGYTTMRIDKIAAVQLVDTENVDVEVTLQNSGARHGRHVVQIYAAQQTNPTLPRRALIGFLSVELDAGTTATVPVRCSLRPLQRWEAGQFKDPAGEWQIEASSFAGDPRAAIIAVTLPGGDT